MLCETVWSLSDACPRAQSSLLASYSSDIGYRKQRAIYFICRKDSDTRVSTFTCSGGGLLKDRRALAPDPEMAVFEANSWVWVATPEECCLPARVKDVAFRPGEPGRVIRADGEVGAALRQCAAWPAPISAVSCGHFCVVPLRTTHAQLAP
jgi:hypothetical protein